MHQSARHEVLGGLGLRSWYCKYTLPNAATTPAKIFTNAKPIEDFSNESEVALKSASTALELPNPARVILTSVQVVNSPSTEQGVRLDEEKLVLSNKEDLNNESSAIDTSALNSLPITELILTAVVFDKIVVLYESPVSDGSVLEKDLLENIIRAVTERQVEHRAKESVFSWPAFRSGALIKEQSSYFDKLAKRWLEQQSWSECSHMLYFGEHCSALESIILGVRAEQSLEFILVPFRNSLFDLLNSPINKKNLWDLFSSVGIASD